jgi:hypothetical protein
MKNAAISIQPSAVSENREYGPVAEGRLLMADG